MVSTTMLARERGVQGSQYTPTQLTTVVHRNFQIRNFRRISEDILMTGCPRDSDPKPVLSKNGTFPVPVFRLVARRRMRLASPSHGSIRKI